MLNRKTAYLRQQGRVFRAETDTEELIAQKNPALPEAIAAFNDP